MAYQCPCGMVIVVNAAHQPVVRRSGAGKAGAAAGIRRGIGGPGGPVKAWPAYERPWGGS